MRHGGNSFSLLHGVWGLKWEDATSGSDSWLGESVGLGTSGGTTCLMANAGCALGLQLGLSTKAHT